MSTDQSTNLGLPFLMPAQAQKHVTVNESLLRLDALVQLVVESRTLSAQPGAPADGSLWILPPGKTGPEWGGYANGALAYYRDGAWEAIAPRPGWRAFVKDEGLAVRAVDGGWSADWSIGSLNGGPLAGFRNAVINGGFQIWQRGTSFNNPTANSYLADRWTLSWDGAGATRTISRQPFPPGQTDVPGEPTYFLRWEQPVAGSGGAFNNLVQRIEDVRTFAGYEVTVSFYARADAPRTLSLLLRQLFGSGGSSQVDVPFNPSLVEVGTNWKRYVANAAVPALSGKTIGAAGARLDLQFRLTPNASFTFDIAQVQLEPGSNATPCERRPFSIELALCERYFEKSYDFEVAPGTTALPGAEGLVSNGTAMRHAVRFRTRKRTVPVVTTYNPSTGGSGSWRDLAASADRAATASDAGEGGFTVALTSTVHQNAMTGHWIADAEL